MNYSKIDFVVMEIDRLGAISDDDADRIMRTVLAKMGKEPLLDGYTPHLNHDAPEPEWMRA